MLLWTLEGMLAPLSVVTILLVRVGLSFEQSSVRDAWPFSYVNFVTFRNAIRKVVISVRPRFVAWLP